MKKIILSSFAVFVFSMIGCKTGGGDPKSVLMNFMDALGKKDIETAKKYATKDSDAMLGMIQMSMSMIPDSAKNKIYDKSNMEFGDAVITGDKATVAVKDKKTGEPTNFTLKKEGGDWKVAFDKTTMMEMGKDKMSKMNNSGNINMSNGMDSLNMNGMDTTHSLQDTMH